MSLLAAIASSRRRASVTYDTDAASYFAAVEAVSSIGTVAKNAANAYVVGLKAASLWTLIHQLYLYAGPNTLDGALVKAKGSGTRVNNGFVSGDFSPSLGLQGNGTSKHITNGFLQNSFAAASHSIFVYSSSGLAVSSGGGIVLSGSYGLAQSSLLNLEAYFNYYAGRGFRSASYTIGNFPVISTGLITSGSVMGSRTSLSLAKIYQNGAFPVSSTATVGVGFTNVDVSSFAQGPSATVSGFSADRRQVEAFAQGLNDTQAQQLHDLTTTYLNALNA